MTGVGQLVGLVGSALIGVLVAGTLPPSPRVDAFFGANQIYALAMYLGQAVRVTAPALLLRAGLAPARLRDATLVLTAAMAAVLVVAALAGAGVVPPASRHAFAADLLLLAPAAALHVLAGGLAARLSVFGSFGYAAAAYAAGSMVSGVVLLVAIDAHGASALAPCLLAGAAAAAAIMAAGYVAVVSRTGGAAEPGAGVQAVRPAVAAAEPPGALDAVRRFGLGAVPALSAQLLVVAFTVAAGHVMTGGTALLSYAFLALFAVGTVAVTPMSVVLGPELAERWDDDHELLASIIRRATGLATVVATPTIAVGFLVGRPLSDALLGALTDADLDQVFVMLALLAPSLLLTAAATAATVGITTDGRLGALAAWLLPVGGVVVVAGFWLSQRASALWQVALVGSLLAAVSGLVTLGVALGWRRGCGLAVRLLFENAPVALPMAVAVAVVLPLVRESVAWGSVAACGVCVAVYGPLVLRLRPDTVRMLAGAVGPPP
ncbi:MAG: hypothetical protein QM679_01125 [Patulibacter sp.]